MTPPDIQPAKRPRWGWLHLALLVSLALNLATLGLIAGAILRGPPPPPQAMGPGLWRYARELPEAYRRDLGQSLRASRGDWIAAREGLRDQRRAFAAALTAEPFAPEALRAALMRENEIADALSAQGAELLVAEIARMSAPERAAYAAEILEDRRERRGPPRR